MGDQDNIEPFPPASDSPKGEAFAAHSPLTDHDNGIHTRKRGDSKASSVASVVRRLSQDFEGSHPPEGFMAATGDIASSVFAEHNHHYQHARTPTGEAKNKTDNQLYAIPSSSEPPKQSSDGKVIEAKEFEAVEQHRPRSARDKQARASETGSRPGASSDDATLTVAADDGPPTGDIKHTEPFENGYHFPPKYTWQESTKQGLAAFWKFFITPMGFFWTIYGLNVVAWGAMIFFLLLNAAPAMCVPDCNDIDSPRRKWIEWDAQILTGLFCVTAFGLAPWRFRDLYYLLKYRILRKESALRQLAGIHKSWFRLRGSQDLPVHIGPDNLPDDVPRTCVPLPETNMPSAPLTGTRAPATKVWKLDFVIWSMVLNTLFQVALCGIMWGMTRYNRPSWATGFLVAMACVIAMAGGLVIFLEGRKIKSIEGVPCTEQDLERLARDKEQGIPHYNNIKDKKPKQEKVDEEANAGKSG